MNNVSYIEDLLYTLKQDFGFPVDIYRLNSIGVDRETGEKTVTKTRYSVAQAIKLPSNWKRIFATQVAFKPFDYGGLFDVDFRDIYIQASDLSITPTANDYVVINAVRYSIAAIKILEEMKGYHLVLKGLANQKPEQIIDLTVRDRLKFNEAIHD